ncbi:MAG: helix-turn-helix transcriptional regulator [Burkholderiales bacterium]|jgi:DNA-binding CsgD family transcriptional regulator|nr:helix-turn-helix transcriptional regulator [Burkholderiales bacterium]
MDNTEWTPGFTEAEKNVVELLLQRRTNVEIARELGRSEGVIRILISSIYEKLRVRNRGEAIALLERQGPLQPGTYVVRDVLSRFRRNMRSESGDAEDDS